LVWPTRIRRRSLKHAFEEALDDARLDAHGDLSELDVPDMPPHPGTGPAIGSLGEVAVASGYVGAHSLAAAYGAEGGTAGPPTVEPPGEAAQQLKAALGKTQFSARELRRLRRRFAAQNHPDRVPTELRAEAAGAMAEVNAEIDRALRKAKDV